MYEMEGVLNGIKLPPVKTDCARDAVQGACSIYSHIKELDSLNTGYVVVYDSNVKVLISFGFFSGLLKD